VYRVEKLQQGVIDRINKVHDLICSLGRSGWLPTPYPGYVSVSDE
jgi:hypothetical protein